MRKKEVTVPLCFMLVKPERAELCGPRGKGIGLKGELKYQLSVKTSKRAI